MNFNSISIPRTPKFEYLKKLLICLCIGHSVFMILYFIGGLSYVFTGLMELFCVWFLIMTQCTGQYCPLIIYVFIVGNNLISAFVASGTRIQHNMLAGWNLYFFTVSTFAVGFYLVGICIVLTAYKEYKYLNKYGTSSFTEEDGNYQSYLQSVRSNDTNENTNTENQCKSYKPFSGKGVFVG